MIGYSTYAKEGAMAGASVGAISGAWSALFAPVLYHFLISSVQLNIGFLVQHAIISAITGAISCAVAGIPLALGLMALQRKKILKESRISCIKYGIAVSIVLSSLTSFSVLSSASIGLIPLTALISLGLIHGAFFLGLWGHWIGKSLYSEQ